MDMSFLENEALKDMLPEKVQVMKELAEAAKGKSLKDTAPLIMKANQKLQSMNLSFTKEETSILLEVLTKDMSPQEKAKVEMMQKIVRDHKK